METDFTNTHRSGEVRLRIKDSSRRKVLRLLREVRHSGSCPPTILPKLCGKLAYVFLLGKAGRAALQHLRERELADVDHDKIDQRLDDTLAFIESLLNGALPDTIVHGVRRTPDVITIFTDASWSPAPPLVHGSAFVSFVVFLPDGSMLFSAEAVPHEVLEKLNMLKARKQPITSLETMALTGVYFSLEPEIFHHRDVNHFGDNSGANGAAARGYSPAPDIAWMVNHMQIRHARHALRVWFEYVPSDSNLADNHTRLDVLGNLESLQTLGGHRRPFLFPSFQTLHVW